MKIYLAVKKQAIGGGWTFLRNFKKSMEKYNVDFVERPEDCDIYFLASASMVTKEDMKYVKSLKKKFLLRVDNFLKDSRNRGTGMSRLRYAAEAANGIVFQSRWAKDKIGKYLEQKGKAVEVILNGADTDIFNQTGVKANHLKNAETTYLIIRHNRDPHKRLEEALEWFRDISFKNKNTELWLFGIYSNELIKYNFDFFAGEQVDYKGVAQDPNYMASVMRAADVLLYPSYYDACPNVVIEARLCGMEIRHNNHSSIPEIMEVEPEFLRLERMGHEYYQFMSNLT